MKLLKGIVIAAADIFFSAVMFYCLMGGASPESIASYAYKAAVLSVLVPALLCFCFCYIGYLQKKLEEALKEK